MTKFFCYQAPLTPVEWVRQLKVLLHREEFVDYGVVDHQKDMKAQGVASPLWAYTVIFGKPAVGATFLAIAPSAVADMPIRLGIYGGKDHSILVYHAMSLLLAAHDGRLRVYGEQIDQTLAALCEEMGATKIVCKMG